MNSLKNHRVLMVVIGAMAIVIVMLLILLMNPEEESDISDDPDALTTLAAATPAGGDALGFAPDDCWSEAPATEVELGEGNVFLAPQWSEPPGMVIEEDASYQAVLTTNKGDMTFDLNAEAAPATVNNFICLATNGFYDGTPFHRVLAGFMVQAGDPTGTGGGGPGYRFDDELRDGDLEYPRGTLAMANAGPDTQGSQFFIVHQDSTENLQPLYTTFGQLVDGEDVLDDIADSSVVPAPNGEPSRPVEHLLIEDVTIRAGS